MDEKIRAKAEKVKEAIPHSICPCCVDAIEAALTEVGDEQWDAGVEAAACIADGLKYVQDYGLFEDGLTEIRCLKRSKA